MYIIKNKEKTNIGGRGEKKNKFRKQHVDRRQVTWAMKKIIAVGAIWLDPASARSPSQ